MSYNPRKRPFQGHHNQGFRQQGWSEGRRDDKRRNELPKRGGFKGKPDGGYDNLLQLWMGDLDYSWNETSIMLIWNSLGESPTSVKIIREKNVDQTRGKPLYCFVTFPSPVALSSAFQKNGSSIPGSRKRLRLNQASGSTSGGNTGGSTRSNEVKNHQEEYTLFIGDLDIKVKENQVFDTFNSNYPNSVKQVKIMKDSTTGKSKGFGFIKFNSNSAQQAALKNMNGTIMNGTAIKVGLTASTSANGTLNGPLPTIDTSKIQLPQSQPPMNCFTDPNNTTIKVKGIRGQLTTTEILNYFESFGKIVYHNNTINDEGIMIRYLLRNDAERAILHMNNSKIKDCHLSVNWTDIVINDKKFNSPYTVEDDVKQLIKPPLIYGDLTFDLLNHTQDQILSNPHDESEPYNDLDRLYIRKKDNMQSVLSSQL